MKKLCIAVLSGLLISGVAFADTTSTQPDANAALKTFGQDLQNIRTQLENGKMSAMQASVLLSAIQARQNQVIIAQNQEIIQLLQTQQSQATEVQK